MTTSPRFTKIKKSLMKNKKQEARVILVRHGATDYNNDDKSLDRIRGWINVPLNDKGIQDAKDAAAKLKDEPIKLVYSSDLSRALETAKIINRDHHAPLIESKDLRPWNLGVYQGKKTDTILGDMIHMIRSEDIVPKDGESFKSFRIRYLSMIHSIIKQAQSEKCLILVATHYRNLKCVDSWVLKGMPLDYEIDTEAMLKDEFRTGETYEIPIHRLPKK